MNNRLTKRVPWGITCTVLMALSASAWSSTTAVVNPRVQFGTWRGWGCSLAWWANELGDRQDVADLLYSFRATKVGADTLPGLGLNIVRYNVGGSGPGMVVSKALPVARQIQGFWVDGNSEDPASSSWNWNLDLRQRRMMQLAKQRGADVFEMFSNSPMWWMCGNHNPSGAPKANHDNLSPEYWHAHAVYMATVAKHAANYWGIHFEGVEPFNEPMTNYWGETGHQEGCHFDVSSQYQVIRQLRQELDARGLSDVKVAASDETSYDQALASWRGLGVTGRARVSRLNVHGYQYVGGARADLYEASAGKELWNSEYGEADRSGLAMASNLILDLKKLHPTAWCYWQPFDVSGWGCIDTDLTNYHFIKTNPKWYVLAQFTRHIRPGMQMIDIGDSHSVAALDVGAHRLVIVSAYTRGEEVKYDLGVFRRVGRVAKQWTTGAWIREASHSPRHQSRPDIVIRGKSFSATISDREVHTFEVEDVSL